MLVDQQPISLDDFHQWFPQEQQNHYVSSLLDPLERPVGLTRKRATYLVRLWAYLSLKHQYISEKSVSPSLTKLSLPPGYISCTHREAAEIFYGDQDQGSDRAAGMMIDKLADLGFINKQFDGNTLCLEINPLPKFNPPVQDISLKSDQFNPRTDAIPVANFLMDNYQWMNIQSTATPYNITQVLRKWAQQYPPGMRVLRRCDHESPVGVSIFYPTAQVSEPKFFSSPSKSLHLGTGKATDPIQVAQPGDPNCHVVFIRSWMIDRPYLNAAHVCQFLKDSQATLRRLQQDFPNLYDLYALVIHPSIKTLEVALGFQKTYQDAHSDIYWIYKSIDHFLDLDLDAIISDVDF